MQTGKIIKLMYVANTRMPTEKAHGLQIMKMCEAFARQGAIVKLVVPWRFNPIKEDPFEYYGIEKNFKITKLPSLDLVKLGKIGFLIQSFSFAKCAFWYALFRKADAVYSRDELPLFYISFLNLFALGGKNLFWESHDGRLNFFIKRVLLKCKEIVSISQGLKNFYVEKGINPGKILVAPDGVDLKEFDIPISKEEARKKLGLPLNKKITLYTGSFYLYDWKGIDVLLSAAKLFSNEYLFLLVGGNIEEIKKVKDKYKSENILLIGRRPHRDMPYYLKAADVLVLPNKKSDEISEKYTSPLKLFEYMASGRPIIASDLPSIREILNTDNAILVQSDDPQSLAEGINVALKNFKLADKISNKAFQDAGKYSWIERAKNILNFL